MTNKYNRLVISNKDKRVGSIVLFGVSLLFYIGFMTKENDIYTIFSSAVFLACIFIAQYLNYYVKKFANVNALGFIIFFTGLSFIPLLQNYSKNMDNIMDFMKFTMIFLAIWFVLFFIAKHIGENKAIISVAGEARKPKNKIIAYLTTPNVSNIGVPIIAGIILMNILTRYSGETAELYIIFLINLLLSESIVGNQFYNLKKLDMIQKNEKGKKCSL